jgi:hypothetical protein
VALGHRVIYVDVSVVHPTAVSYRLTASRRTLSTAARAEGTKARQYAERAAAEHADFVPFIIESYGGFGKQARRFANEIAAHARIGSDLWSPHDVRARLQRGVHDALWMRNLRMMTKHSRLPQSASSKTIRSCPGLSTGTSCRQHYPSSHPSSSQGPIGTRPPRPRERTEPCTRSKTHKQHPVTTRPYPLGACHTATPPPARP